MNILQLLKQSQKVTDASTSVSESQTISDVPKGFPNARFPHYMPCVEHCVSRIATLWKYKYGDDPNGACILEEMGEKLCTKVCTHPNIKHFRINDDPIIRKWADEIEIEVLKKYSNPPTPPS